MDKVKCDKCDGTGFIKLNGIKEYRKFLKLSQEDVGNAIGIGRTGYTMIENGKARLTIDKLQPLAKVLRTDITTVANWLSKGKDNG